MMYQADCKMMNKDMGLIVCVDDPAEFDQTGETSGQYLMRMLRGEDGRKTVYIVLQPDN